MSELEELLVEITKATLMGKPYLYALLDILRDHYPFLYRKYKQSMAPTTLQQCHERIIQLIKEQIEAEKIAAKCNDYTGRGTF